MGASVLFCHSQDTQLASRVPLPENTNGFRGLREILRERLQLAGFLATHPVTSYVFDYWLRSDEQWGEGDPHAIQGQRKMRPMVGIHHPGEGKTRSLALILVEDIHLTSAGLGTRFIEEEYFPSCSARRALWSHDSCQQLNLLALAQKTRPKISL
jgi:hypothetical protein